MNRPLRVLFISHGHPGERAGGAEVYAWELYQSMRASSRFEACIITRCESAPNQGVLTRDPADPGHYRLATPMNGFDLLYQELHTHADVAWWVAKLLRELQPDVVHFQHTLFLGLRLLPLVREVLPTARIVYTLHEYLPMCFHRGLLMRTRGGVLCEGPTPEDCHACFPDVSPATFMMRDWFVRHRFSVVDRFIAPSQFLQQRFIAWGIEKQRIVVEEYGRLPVPTVPVRAAPRHDQFGYFGQITPFKGIDVLLAAVLKLMAKPNPPAFHVHINGANLDLQLAAWRDAYRRLLADALATGRVTDHGSYTRSQQAERMAHVDWVVVPSIWWENSPLVIQEAMAAGRPVIASDIGGTAEKVQDRHTGLHFLTADADSLAATMAEAVATPELWSRLRDTLIPPYAMNEHLQRLEHVYFS